MLNLRLRGLSAADVAYLSLLWQGGNRHNEAVAVQTASAIRMNESSVHWAVCLLDSDDLLGYFCLQDIDLTHSQAELRFWMDPDRGWQRRAVEAGQAVLGYAFDQLSLISLHAFSACGQRATEDALLRMGLQPLKCGSVARASWDMGADVQVWNLARHRWLRGVRM